MMKKIPDTFVSTRLRSFDSGMVDDLMDLAWAAFIGEKNDECDMCNRYPDSSANGLKLCSLCEVGEFFNMGDTADVHFDLVDLGFAEDDAK